MDHSSSSLLKPSKTLPNLLGEVILEQQGQFIFDTVEKLRKGFIQQRKKYNAALQIELMDTIASLEMDDLNHVIHAFSTFFHLSNISEEQVHHQQRSQTQNWANSFEETIQQFKAQGKSLSQVLELIKTLNYYPTFTAHPTEAKRRTLLEALNRIHTQYQALDNKCINELETHEIEQKLKAMIQIFWKTDALRPP